MTFSGDDRGQMYTIEGIAASIVLLGVLLFIVQTNAVVTPQTEKNIDVGLYLMAGDTLSCIDRVNEEGNSSLKLYIAAWNGTPASYTSITPTNEGSIEKLASEITSMLPVDTKYNAYVVYENGGLKTIPIILNGEPGDNSVAVSRILTLNSKDPMSIQWKLLGAFPRVVEVRLVCWYL